MTTSSRRRLYQLTSTDTTPLGAEKQKSSATAFTTTYATFPSCVKQQNHETLFAFSSGNQPFKRAELVSKLYKRFSMGVDSPILRFFHQDHGESKQCRYVLDQLPWRVIVAASACFCLSFYQVHCRGDYSAPEWRWDHNVYAPRQQHSSGRTPASTAPFASTSMSADFVEKSADTRNMLLAQVTGGNEILRSLGDICSRPNRAYARQWGHDYVRYSKPAPSLVRSCFDKVTLLSTILRLQKQTNDKSLDDNSNWVHPPGVVYDVIALFPPDAIITDLDDDLLNLLPEDKLLAIAGWNKEGDSSIKESNLADVLFLNLKHKHASTVVELWQSMVEPPVTCGAGNDLTMLLDAVESVFGVDDLSSVVEPLTENRKGMIEGNAIKVIPVTVPGPKASMLVAGHAETKVILQTTADSVCYRYYPKCEVF
ncbi:hypothetical protein ACA910_000156 [Epithemia clementina (nom. ined.)]